MSSFTPSCEEIRSSTSSLASSSPVYEDRSFDIRIKTPLTSALLREAAGLQKGSSSPDGRPVGTITREQLRRIAGIKLPD